jgi:hypothetical protein
VEGDRGARLGEEKVVEVFDGESRMLDRPSGVAAEVAAAEQRRPDAGIQQALDAGEAEDASPDVFQEAQLPAWFDHAESLAQRLAGVGDGAQGEGVDGGVQAGVRAG